MITSELKEALLGYFRAERAQAMNHAFATGAENKPAIVNKIDTLLTEIQNEPVEYTLDQGD